MGEDLDGRGPRCVYVVVGPVVTLRCPFRQCSSSWPAGSSVKREKPDRPQSRMHSSLLSVHTNSLMVVDPSKLTT